MKIYEFKNLNVHICGDVHAQFETMQHHVKRAENVLYIIAGDCGFGFKKPQYYFDFFSKLNETLTENNTHILFTRGNHDCLHKDTLVLTKRGWVDYTNLSMDDMVLSFNPETQESEWHGISNIIVRDSDFIYTQKSPSLEMGVTENHRHLLYTKNGEYVYKRTNEINTYNSLSDKIIHGAPISNGEYKISDDEIKLVAWLMTDGYYNNTKHNYFNISQSKEKSIENIKTILSNLKCDYGISIRNRNDREIIIKGRIVKNKKNETIFRLKSEFSKYIVDNFLNDKFELPTWVYDLSYRQLKIFTDTLIEANGTAMVHKGNWILYGTYDMLYQFQPLFNMCGYRCTLVLDKRGDWRLNICENNKSNILCNGRTFKKQEYNDKVFCLTTELSNFFVSFHGKCYFTGNCPSYFTNEIINFSNVKTIPDYSIVKVVNEKETKNILCIGGATSIDRMSRIENDNYIASFGGSRKSYWEDEQPVFNEEALDEIKEAGIKINAVVTHTCPSFCYPTTKEGIKSWLIYDKDLSRDLDIERGIMDNIYHRLIKEDKHPIKEWCYGHFHDSYTMEYENVIFRLLYDMRDWYSWGSYILMYIDEDDEYESTDECFEKKCCEGEVVHAVANHIDQQIVENGLDMAEDEEVNDMDIEARDLPRGPVGVAQPEIGDWRGIQPHPPLPPHNNARPLDGVVGVANGRGDVGVNEAVVAYDRGNNGIVIGRPLGVNNPVDRNYYIAGIDVVLPDEQNNDEVVNDEG